MIKEDTTAHFIQKYQLREEPERLYLVAGNYWRAMLSVAVVVFTLAVVGGGYMLVITSFNMSVNRAQSGEPQSLNRNELTRVVGNLAERERRFSELQVSVDTTPDPSR